MQIDRRIRAFALAATFAAMSAAAPAAADPLDGLVGKKRAVLLFAKSRSDASIDRQLGLLQERRPEMEDRDMVAITILGDRDAIAAIGYVSLPTGAGRDLRRRFEPRTSGMTIVLVGRDGREKGRWLNTVNPGELFDVIDDAIDSGDEAGRPNVAG